MGKYRPQSGRILTELLYGEAPCLSDDGKGNITIELTGFARICHIRPVRIVRNLEWMAERGIIEHMEFGYRTVTVRLKPSARILRNMGD